MSFTLRPYQQEAVERGVKFLEQDHGRHGLIVLPTGSGKSLAIASIDDRWCRWCQKWMEDSEECAFCGRQTIPYSEFIDQAYERQVEKELLESARSHVITPEEHAAQVVSFVYGNLAIENPAITREEVQRQQEKELTDADS